MSDKFGAWLILVAVVSLPTGAYLLAWRCESLPLRRVASWAVATILGFAALYATLETTMALIEIPGTEVGWRAEIIEPVAGLAISAAAWTIAIRFAVLTLRGSTERG